MPAPEELLPRQSSQHPTSGHTQDRFHFAAPPPEVHSRRSQIVGGLVSKGDTYVLHCWRVTSVVFMQWCLFLVQRTQDTTYYARYWRQVLSSACFDSTYAGHYLLCPLLKTGVQWCLCWFNIRRTPPTMPPTEDRCSVVPVLIQHAQDTTYYAPYWRQVFSDACVDSTYAGHPLLCPLLKTGAQ